jgi:hypothetical protein
VPHHIPAPNSTLKQFEWLLDALRFDAQAKQSEYAQQVSKSVL